MKYTVNVTQENIDLGKRASTFSCPVARACRQAIPGFSSCSDVVFIGGTMLPMPIQVVCWMDDFDWGREVHPFTFELVVP